MITLFIRGVLICIAAFIFWKIWHYLSLIEQLIKTKAEEEEKRRNIHYNVIDDRFWEMTTKYNGEINRIWHYIKQQGKTPPEDSKPYRREV